MYKRQLYGALKRLLALGWIQRVGDPTPNQTQRVRKAYALTDLGNRVLNAEIQRLNALLNIVQFRKAEGEI